MAINKSDAILLPANSSIVVETLRKLRNDDSHGYDIPEFEEMYELFTQNEEVFVSIRNACKKDFTEKLF
ncbi:oligo-1,6-glucosidase [Romboutsia sedimentorum]|uniref:Oligo-1,6-glucosidase n=1 Tax=Romboutsia sedimentorum TaxID=1368474 RepID=A0ABT7E9P2_9FIRM|nr:oligo-1,6-glucosidase [Romboutsia sedimentorum]MDK2562225.1 oligo-1,6-glucosidase [Romboutsia sedimentorum]